VWIPPAFRFFVPATFGRTPKSLPPTSTSTNTSASTTSETGDTISTSTSAITITINETGDKKENKHQLRLVESEPNLETVKKKALEIYKKEGKLPGRPRLQHEAGCRENHARRALQELKEELKQAI
jgi:hypothetical protein